jgi:spermidine synthase
MAKAKKWSAGKGGAIAVSEARGVRTLHIGGDANQSAMRLSAPDELELEYTRAMMAFLLFCPVPRDVLMVGLGAGSIPRFMRARMPDARVTVVEINPGVVTAARHYFGLPPEDKRLRIVLGDGAAYVPRHPASADVLLLDGFEDGAHASELCTQAFYDAAYEALREGGVLSANFMADDPKRGLWSRRIAKSFGGRVLVLSAEDDVNVIVLAFRGGPVRVAWDELKTRARALKRLTGLPFDYFLSSLKAGNAHTATYLRMAPEPE